MDPTTDYEPGPTDKEARCQELSTLAGVGHNNACERHPPPVMKPPVLEKQALFSRAKDFKKKKKSLLKISGAFADNTVLDILTKMDTEINPEECLKLYPKTYEPGTFQTSS